MGNERIKTCLSYVFEYAYLPQKSDRLKAISKTGVETKENNWLIQKGYMNDDYMITVTGRLKLKET